MSKYKAGDKVVMEIIECNDNLLCVSGKSGKRWFLENHVEDFTKPLSEYTEKLEKKNENKQKRIEKLVERLHRQADEITRLLAENAELKEKLRNMADTFENFNTAVCDACAHIDSVEKARAAGEEAAWELAGKILETDYETLMKIFGSDRPFERYITKGTYTEAAAKVAEWERQNEICVGDVVKAKDRECAEFCVTDIDDEGAIYGISANGGVYCGRNSEDWEKTGRHIDVNAMLAQIGVKSNGTD